MTNQLQTGSDAAMYRFPHSNEEELLAEPEVVASPRPLEAGEAARVYADRMRELSEEASRLALSSIGGNNPEAISKSEIATTPEVMRDIQNVARLIAAARESVIVQVSEQLTGMSKVLTNGRAEVAKEEEAMAVSLLSGVPDGEQWKLYLHDGDVFVERAKVDHV